MLSVFFFLAAESFARNGFERFGGALLRLEGDALHGTAGTGGVDRDADNHVVAAPLYSVGEIVGCLVHVVFAVDERRSQELIVRRGDVRRLINVSLFRFISSEVKPQE